MYLRGKSGRGVKQTAHLHVVPRIKKHVKLYVFMVLGHRSSFAVTVLGL
jgi:hypothetical protein